MSRSRGTIVGGYVRKTVSLPKKLHDDLEEYLQKHEGMTMSAAMTSACEGFLLQQKTTRKAR